MTFWTSLLTFFGCNSKDDNLKIESDEGKIEMIDPNDILMTISTIENTLPGTNDQPKDSLDLEILEDDWRQLEFILRKHQNAINNEIDSINLIIKNESVEVGENMIAFKNIHVRKSIPKPLDEGIELSELQEIFSSFKTGSLSFSQYGKANNGIYFSISDFQLYGLITDSKVTAFAFYGLSTWDNLTIFKTELKNLMEKYDMVLVDWRSRMVIEVDGIDGYLKPSE